MIAMDIEETANSNLHMVDRMRESGHLDPRILSAFLSVDRASFLPSHMAEEAYVIRPVRSGIFHQSAPDIYASALRYLDLLDSPPGKALSFLNVGSGTGYMQALVDSILLSRGVLGVSHGVDIHDELREHAEQRYRNCLPGASSHTFFFCGNGLSIDSDTNIHYDRIYVGAGSMVHHEEYFLSLLSPGGVLVGPFGMNMMRLKKSDVDTEEGERLIQREVISMVSFAPLVQPQEDDKTVILKSFVWNPSRACQSIIPVSFKEAIVALHMSSLKAGGVCSRVPVEIWHLILSYCTRHWFDGPVNEVDNLRRQLRRERQSRRRLEGILAEVERERDHAMALCMIFRRRLIQLSAHPQEEQEEGNQNEVDGDDIFLLGLLGGDEDHRSDTEISSENDSEGEEDL